jgi:hypothetical protein
VEAGLILQNLPRYGVSMFAKCFGESYRPTEINWPVEKLD